jgi:ribose 5-phosphate isomerase A
LSWVDEAKRKAAEAAAAHVESGTVIGLGSGSTAREFIGIIGRRLASNELRDIKGVPTGHQARLDALKAGIPLTDLDTHPELAISVDGADQIDEGLRAIKGGGGALLREKVVAASSREYILIADERKLTSRLGEGCPLPVEVLPFSLGPVRRKIEGLVSTVAVRMAEAKLGPVITDNGNFIVDADFGYIEDPEGLDAALKAIPGVLETGLFIGHADTAYIGTAEGVKRLGK